MNKTYYSVSRVEENVAVIEFPNGEFNEVPFSLLPSDIKEGNILVPDEDGCLVHDYEEENIRKNRLLSLQNDIFG